ncbi:MAG: tripartite tricarboxylate transporter substrate binding protein [Hyphomicrobiaceae bacterium]
MRLMHFASGMLAAMGLAVAAGSVAAQDYPTKPINIIVGFGAGGGTDAFVRAVAEPMSKALGQPILVTNKPGAGGGVAAMTIKNAAPDGYTLIATGSLTYSFEPQVLKTQYSYKDFEHVAITTLFQDGLFVHPSRPYKSMKDIINAAKAEKRPIKYASQYQLDRLIFRYVAKKEGVEIIPVPTQGGNGAVQATLANQVDFGFSGGTFGPQVESGALRLVGSMMAERMERFPDILSMHDNGWDIGSGNYIIFSTTKGTPKAIVDKLSSAILEAAKADAPRAIVKARYMKEDLHNAADSVKVLERQLARYGKMIAENK